MQALLTVKLAGDAGVNHDLEPCDLPLEMFTDGNNYVRRNGKIQSYYGSTLITKEPVGASKLAQIMFVNSPPNNYYICMGLKEVFLYDGSVWESIASLGATDYDWMQAGDEYLWSYCMLGLIPVINNYSTGVPQYWSPQTSGTKLQDLPWSVGVTWRTKGYYAGVIRSHKNFLFALRMNQGGTEYPNNYRWSTAADNNGLPYTWDETDLSAIAGTASILGGRGPIVDGMSLRDSFVIYTTDSITVLDYTGDNYVFRARSLSSTVGLLTQNCIASVNNVHIFLSRGDIMLTDGNSVRSIADRKIRSKLKDLASSSYYHKCYCVVDERLKEVWFCIPIDGSTYPNYAIIYNVVDDTLSTRNIDRSISSMCYGTSEIKSASWDGLIDVVEIWSDATHTWESMPGQWGTGIESVETWTTKTGNWHSDDASPFSYEIIGIEPAGSGVYNLSANDNSSGDYTWLERTGAVFGDQRNVTSIVRAYPHMQGKGTVSIQMGSMQFVGGGTEWSEPAVFNPSNDRKVDIRTTGKLHGWRIQSLDIAPFTYAGMDIEYTNNGLR